MKAEVHDIVQITDETHHWFAALIVVTELKGWGIMGYAPIPHNDDTGTTQAFIRVKNEAFEVVGRAVIVTARVTDDE